MRSTPRKILMPPLLPLSLLEEVEVGSSLRGLEEVYAPGPWFWSRLRASLSLRAVLVRSEGGRMAERERFCRVNSMVAPSLEKTVEEEVLVPEWDMVSMSR